MKNGISACRQSPEYGPRLQAFFVIEMQFLLKAWRNGQRNLRKEVLCEGEAQGRPAESHIWSGNHLTAY